MAKRIDTTGIDPDLVIRQAKPSNREKELKPYDPAGSDAVSGPSSLSTAEPEAAKEKEPPRRKRPQGINYKETYLRRNEIKTRQCVYISHDVHAVITKLVRALVDAGNDISVGGYIDTVLNEHLQQHKEDINEVYRQRQGDLLE